MIPPLSGGHSDFVAGAGQWLQQEAPEMLAGAVEAVRAAVTPEVVKSEAFLILGPWLRPYGVLVDEDARIDDAPDFSGRLAGPEGRDGTWNEPGVLGDPASRKGTSVIGVEAGLLKFLALDLEAVSKLGRAYLAGSVDFAKVKAEIFGDLILDLPELAFSNWRYTGDPRFEIGARVGVQVLAELIGAHYEVGYDTPSIPMLGRELPVEFTARLDAAVHAFARAYADGSIGTRSALMVGAKAFAGASATLAGQVELASLFGAHGSVTCWAGAGAEFTLGVEADFEEHDYGFKNSAGVAVGVGASYDYGVTVHPGEVLSSSGLSGPLLEILGEFVERVEASGRSALAGETSPSEFTGEVVSAAGKALGAVAVAVDDSLP